MMIESSSPGAGWRRDLLLLGVLLFVVYGFMLGCYPLGNPDEGRYAEIPREMIESGDWVTPRLNGVKYFEKPPLVYWGGAVAMQVFGHNEWAARLMPALCAIFGVLATYAVGRRIHGRAAGWAAAGVLATSLLYFALGHILLLDMPVSAFMSGTPASRADVRYSCACFESPFITHIRARPSSARWSAGSSARISL